MAVYSTQLIRMQAGVTPVEFTVPSGFVAVIRDVAVAGDQAPDGIVLGVAGSTTMIQAWSELEILGAFSQRFWSGRIVANAGDLIEAVSFDTASCIVSGYLLTA